MCNRYDKPAGADLLSGLPAALVRYLDARQAQALHEQERDKRAARDLEQNLDLQASQNIDNQKADNE